MSDLLFSSYGSCCRYLERGLTKGEYLNVFAKKDVYVQGFLLRFFPSITKMDEASSM